MRGIRRRDAEHRAPALGRRPCGGQRRDRVDGGAAPRCGDLRASGPRRGPRRRRSGQIGPPRSAGLSRRPPTSSGAEAQLRFAANAAMLSRAVCPYSTAPTACPYWTTAYRMLRALERAGTSSSWPSQGVPAHLKQFELGSRVASRTTLRDLAAVEVERLAQQAGSPPTSACSSKATSSTGPGQDRGAAGGEPDAGQPGPRTCTAWARRCSRGRPRGRAIVGPGPYRAGPSTRSPPTKLVTELTEIRRLGTPSTGRSSTSACGRGRADPRSQADPAAAVSVSAHAPPRRGRGGTPGQLVTAPLPPVILDS